VGCGGHGGSDMTAAFGAAGLWERRRLPGTNSSSPFTTYVPSQIIGRNHCLTRAALLPRHPLHPHKRSAWHCCGACTGLAGGDVSHKPISLIKCPSPGNVSNVVRGGHTRTCWRMCIAAIERNELRPQHRPQLVSLYSTRNFLPPCLGTHPWSRPSGKKNRNPRLPSHNLTIRPS
jgi:hypothetical protein